MADISVTAASVAAGTGSSVDKSYNAGATVTAGQTVYLEAATSTWKLADANSGTAEARTPSGVALHASLAGQPLAVLTGGPLTLNAVLTAGVVYYQSGTAGGIAPVADVTTGWYVTALGIATSTTSLNVKISASGVAL